jgi:CheY-like chemotaxis protein
MSHDLRAPLNTILGFAQIIDSDTPPPTLAQAASVEQILRSGWYLLELINEIVDLSQLESGNLVLSMEPTSLSEVLRECQAIIVPQGRKRSIKMTFPPYGIPYFVNADRARLKQVLISLLSNAIKYNRLNGTVVVDCAMSTNASTPERIRVSIGDTGAGLSPDMLPHLFQPFERLGLERSAEEGTGIGLVMSKRLVELMGGVIGAESTVGSGSVFWFELNLAAEPQLELDGAHSAIVEVPVRNGAPVRSTVLYVEDNPANLELIRQIIARSPNISLLTAEDGPEGILLARAKRPDVILMDINLPGISGIEALKILRADPAIAHIPVVALSANAMIGDIEKALKAGFFRYLSKPIKVKEFMETLEVALEFAALGRGH